MFDIVGFISSFFSGGSSKRKSETRISSPTGSEAERVHRATYKGIEHDAALRKAASSAPSGSEPSGGSKTSRPATQANKEFRKLISQGKSPGEAARIIEQKYGARVEVRKARAEVKAPAASSSKPKTSPPKSTGGASRTSSKTPAGIAHDAALRRAASSSSTRTQSRTSTPSKPAPSKPAASHSRPTKVSYTVSAPTRHPAQKPEPKPQPKPQTTQAKPTKAEIPEARPSRPSSSDMPIERMREISQQTGITNPQLLYLMAKDMEQKEKQQQEQQRVKQPPVPQEVIHGLAPQPENIEEQANREFRRLIAQGKSPQEAAKIVSEKYGAQVTVYELKPVEDSESDQAKPTRAEIPEARPQVQMDKPKPELQFGRETIRNPESDPARAFLMSTPQVQTALKVKRQIEEKVESYAQKYAEYEERASIEVQKVLPETPSWYKKYVIPAMYANPALRPQAVVADWLVGTYEGLRQRPLTTATSLAIGVAIPAVGTAAEAGSAALASRTGVQAIRAATSYGQKVIGGLLGIGYAGSVGYRLYETHQEGGSVPRELGKITSTELVPLAVGGLVGLKATEKAVDVLRTVGKEEIPIESTTFRKVAEGKARFPTVESQDNVPFRVERGRGDKLVEYFIVAPEYYGLPYERAHVRATTGIELPPEAELRTGVWHATPGSFPKQTTTQVGTSESPGLYVSPALSPHFLKVAGEGYKPFSLDIPSVGRPTTLRIFVNDVERLPTGSFAEQNRFLMEKAEKGKAYVSPAFERGKTELEAIIPPETHIQRFGSNYFVRWRGRRIPIQEYTVLEKDPARDILLADREALSKIKIGSRGSMKVRDVERYYAEYYAGRPSVLSPYHFTAPMFSLFSSLISGFKSTPNFSYKPPSYRYSGRRISSPGFSKPRVSYGGGPRSQFGGSSYRFSGSEFSFGKYRFSGGERFSGKSWGGSGFRYDSRNLVQEYYYVPDTTNLVPRDFYYHHVPEQRWKLKKLGNWAEKRKGKYSESLRYWLYINPVKGPLDLLGLKPKPVRKKRTKRRRRRKK